MEKITEMVRPCYLDARPSGFLYLTAKRAGVVVQHVRYVWVDLRDGISASTRTNSISKTTTGLMSL